MDFNSVFNNQPQARVAERKMINGRARVSVQDGIISSGRLVDISLFGICIMLENMIPSKKICAVQFETMLNGKRIVLSLRAVAVYSILVSGKGFRVGFNFGPVDEETTKIIRKLIG